MLEIKRKLTLKPLAWQVQFNHAVVSDMTELGKASHKYSLQASNPVDMGK